MPDSAPSQSGPLKQIIHLFLVVLVILYLAKIYLRDPNYRPVEVCYMPYKIAHLLWVDAWGASSLMTPHPC
ncbi:hypothetical protein F2S72_08640 [Pseudomonas syringae pv. actinidiae]|nr:hypothetical protein [Pseudomonas syringae pv. actinidiae]